MANYVITGAETGLMDLVHAESCTEALSKSSAIVVYAAGDVNSLTYAFKNGEFSIFGKAEVPRRFQEGSLRPSGEEPMILRPVDSSDLMEPVVIYRTDAEEELIVPRTYYHSDGNPEGALVKGTRSMDGYYRGRVLVFHVAAPGTGRLIQQVTKVDEEGAWGVTIEDTSDCFNYEEVA